jgi:ribonuclease HI
MWYSVHSGKIPGVYSTWKECQAQVSGWKGAKFKKFETRQDAEYFSKHGIDRSTVVEAEQKQAKSNSKSHISVYTDGSCIRKNGNVWTGMGVFWEVGSEKNHSQNLTGIALSNNQAELMAIRHALQTIQAAPLPKPVVIYTDSKYSIESIEKYPKKKHIPEYPNKALIAETSLLLTSLNKNGISVSLEHIYAHSHRSDIHSIGNRYADQLAFQVASS